MMAFTPDSLDNASILVCGGGGVALDVTRKLKEAGSWVWQLQRTDVRRLVVHSSSASSVSTGDGSLAPVLTVLQF